MVPRSRLPARMGRAISRKGASVSASNGWAPASRGTSGPGLSAWWLAMAEEEVGVVGQRAAVAERTAGGIVDGDGDHVPVGAQHGQHPAASAGRAPRSRASLVCRPTRRVSRSALSWRVGCGVHRPRRHSSATISASEVVTKGNQHHPGA